VADQVRNRPEKESVKLFLLGPGKDFLDYRRRVKQELLNTGYYKEENIIIMEDLKKSLLDASIVEMFERIVREFDPTLIIAFFHKRAKKMDAVMFEIGFICCRYGAYNVHEKLRLLYEKKYNFDKTSAYIQTLFPFTPNFGFDDKKEYSRASKMIDTSATVKVRALRAEDEIA
jgi:hypothetical protein